MDQIAGSGKEISKIVASIDEIAFQTNLLALNAAVEAARAGDAGSGFAVVADEVRSLALRATKAAKNTQELVDDTAGKINQGNQLVALAQNYSIQVSKSVQQVGSLVREITSASTEQATGIKQINQAMGEMDQAVHRITAVAEESAASSEELNAQAGTMMKMFHQLNNLVHGINKIKREEKRYEPAEQALPQTVNNNDDFFPEHPKKA